MGPLLGEHPNVRIYTLRSSAAMLITSSSTVASPERIRGAQQ